MKTNEPKSSSLYAMRIRKAQNFLEADLSRVPTLEEISRVAGLSSFHFHRLFHAFVGEPVAAYLRRLRIERAAVDLTTSDRKIIDVALAVGFESESSFSKAFKKHFAVTPGAFRKTGTNPSTIQKSTIMKTTTITPQEIKFIDPIPVYYVRKTGAYADAASAAFSSLMPFVYGNRLMTPDSRCFGISWDDPKITDASKLRYDAATSIEKEAPLEGEVERKEIEGGRYAVFLHKGPYENFIHTYDSIFSKWLPNSGESLRDCLPVEEYLNRDPRRTKPENLRTLIYIPLH